MDWADKPQNYKDLYGILQLFHGFHLNNFPQKILKLGWVAFHSETFQLKCLVFQSNQYKKLIPVHSRFCNGLLACYRPSENQTLEKDLLILNCLLSQKVPATCASL